MRAFLIFLPAYMLSQFYRSFLAVIAPELARELALDPQALGNLQALWIAGFVAMQLPVGYALDRMGARRTTSLSMLAAVAGAILFARAHSALALNLAMVLIGVGCSAIYMGAIYVFGRIFPAARFALLCSWLLGIGSAGNLLAATPLAFAAESIGWRGAMLVLAAATLASALSVIVLIRDPPQADGPHRAGALTGIGEILSIRGLWPLLPLTAVGYAAVLSERGLWAGPYLTEVFGLTPVERGNGLLFMAAAMSAGAMAYGPLDRLLGTRKWIVAAGSLVTALSFLALALPGLPLAGAVAVLALLGAFGMTYGVLMAHGRAFVPDHLLGRGITMLNVLFLGGAGLLQPLSGAFMTAMRDGPPAEAYARLHLAFGLTIFVALAIYLLSQEKSPAP
jgi:predicted MFS family arabinose efflux permease